MAWTRTFTRAPVHRYSLHGSLAAAPDGTVVAVLTSDGVHALDGSGADRFTITGISPAPQTGAVAPDGTVGFTQIDQLMASDQTKALRYTGTSLATYPRIPGHTNTSLAFDMTNAVCAISSGMGHSTISRTPTGTSVFTVNKVPIDAFPGLRPFDDGVTPAWFAAGPSNRIAIAGWFGFNIPWIQVYDLP